MLPVAGYSRGRAGGVQQVSLLFCSSWGFNYYLFRTTLDERAAVVPPTLAPPSPRTLRFGRLQLHSALRTAQRHSAEKGVNTLGGEKGVLETRASYVCMCVTGIGFTSDPGYHEQRWPRMVA